MKDGYHKLATMVGSWRTLGSKRGIDSRVNPNQGGSWGIMHQFPTTHSLKAAPRVCHFSGMSKLPHGQAKWSLVTREHLPEAGGWLCALKWRG